MRNIHKYEDFFIPNKSVNEMYEDSYSAMSGGAKESLKSICEGLLCKEAEDYQNDDDNSHTYEGYIEECARYIKECMGRSGYASISKPNAN